MKKIILVLVISLALIGIARAESLNLGETLQKIPALKQGVAYSILDSEFSYLSTIELVNWKGVGLEAGYSSKDKAVAVVSYELLKLKNLGVNLPILDLIEFRPGIYCGYGSINMQEIDRSEIDYGISATFASIKW